jgi:hypothetical protein
MKKSQKSQKNGFLKNLCNCKIDFSENVIQGNCATSRNRTVLKSDFDPQKTCL